MAFDLGRIMVCQQKLRRKKKPQNAKENRRTYPFWDRRSSPRNPHLDSILVADFGTANALSI